MKQRLATGDWFTSRVSACGLLATAYRRAPTALRAELRNLYRDLTHDDTPMVRRAAAANLSKFADAVEPENISKELTTIFHELTQDGELQQVFGLPHILPRLMPHAGCLRQPPAA